MSDTKQRIRLILVSIDGYLNNEDTIGKWFKQTGKRNDIFLATRFANRMKTDGKMEFNNDPEYIKEACAKERV